MRSVPGIAAGCLLMLFACTGEKHSDYSVSELVATTRWVEPRLSLDDQAELCATRLEAKGFCRDHAAENDHRFALIAQREHMLETHERALFHLVRSSDASVAQLLLERHIAHEETSAAAWSDLAAALIVGASDTYDWRSYESAILAAEQALELDEGYDRAQFNLALVLEKLAVEEQAIAMWSRFKDGAGGQHWIDEAANRIRRLQSTDRGNHDIAALVRSLEDDELEVFAAEHPSEIRRFLFGAPGFLGMVLDDYPGFCGKQQQKWQKLGTYVLDQHDDAFLSGFMEGVCTKKHTPGVHEGLEHVVEAIRWHHRSEPGRAIESAEKAQRLLKDSENPFSNLALVLRASVLLINYREGVSEDLLSPKLKHFEAEFPWLGAWSYRILGTLRIRNANNEAAADQLKEGIALLEGGRDPERSLELRALLAETLARGGQYDEAWRIGLDVMRAAYDSMPMSIVSSLCEHLALVAAESGANRLMEVYSNCSIRYLPPDENPTYVASAYIARAEARIERQETRGAEKDLDHARAVVMSIDDPAKRQQALAYVGLSDGRNKLADQPADAVEVLIAVKDYFGRHKNHEQEMIASAGIVDAHMALGQTGEAEAELESLAKLVADVQQAASTAAYSLPIHEHHRSVAERRIRLRLAEGDSNGALGALLEARNPAGGQQAGARDPVSSREEEATLVLAWMDDEVAGWLIDAGGVVRSYHHDAPHARTLVARAAGTDLIPLPDGRARALSELYDLLIKPVAGDLHRFETLRIVPDGLLFGVPFPALRNGVTNTYLAEEITLLISPEFGGWPRAAEHSGDIDSVAVFASAASESSRPLPAAKSEAQGVAGVFQPKAEVQLFTEAEATREQFLEALEEYDLLHFAGHGEVDLTAPMNSQLVLGATGESSAAFVTARELYEYDPKTMPKLIVLAACDTAAYTERLPHALAMVRPLLELGAGEVIGSLRPIPDETYAEMMEMFYRELLRDGNAARALQSMQVEMATDASPGDPGYWAYIQIYGGLQVPRRDTPGETFPSSATH